MYNWTVYICITVIICAIENVFMYFMCIYLSAILLAYPYKDCFCKKVYHLDVCMGVYMYIHITKITAALTRDSI